MSAPKDTNFPLSANASVGTVPRASRRRRPTKRKFNSASGGDDVYTRITNQIIASLEQGVRPWARPWGTGHLDGRVMRPLRHNGLPYAGINVLMLWMAAEEQGFASPTWMTFKQAQELGAHVRKGEHGSLVVYANTFEKTEETTEGEERARTIAFLKGYTVFNVEQIDGLPEQYYAKPPPVLTPIARDAQAEAFFAATKADIRYRGTKAFYAITDDYVQIPPLETFRDAESFYATIAHELTHWTRHPSRLNREFGRKRFGDEGYAKEELVAELGAAFLCADLELTPEIREDHAGYIANWLQVLKDDKRFIVQAASHAQRAAEFLHRLQPNIVALNDFQTMFLSGPD